MKMLEENQIGKVPQNDRVENDRGVEQQLSASLRGYFCWAAQRVNWEFHKGFVILRGHVKTFHEKQMAQELARKVDGVKLVINSLVVDGNETSRIVNEAVFSVRSS